jgi:hypothetical protein
VFKLVAKFTLQSWPRGKKDISSKSKKSLHLPSDLLYLKLPLKIKKYFISLKSKPFADEQSPKKDFN